MTTDLLAHRLALLDQTDLLANIARIEHAAPKKRLVIESLTRALQPLSLDALAALLSFIMALP